MFRNMLGDLLRLIPSGQGVQWELAHQLASQIASGDSTSGASDPNPDPLERIRLEELSAIAELHVTEVTGMPIAPGAGSVRLVPASRGEWAHRVLDTWRPVLDRLAAVIAPPAPVPGATDAAVEPLFEDETGEGEDDAMVALFSQWAAAMFPAMTAMQVGSVAGHLSERALGQYELPLAPVSSNELYVIPANVQATAADWSLPLDDLRLWLCAHELAYHTVLSRRAVAARIADLVVAHADLVRPDATSLGELLEQANPSDLSSLQQLFGNPAALLAASGNPDRDRVRAELDAIMAAVSGYAEHVTKTVVARLIGNHAPIGEAMRRRRVGRGDGEKVAEALFGLSLDQAQLDRGERFVEGVLERSGELQLAKMWTDADNLPTPSEVDAPGLWLARLEFPRED
jgi:putative hydrolase